MVEVIINFCGGLALFLLGLNFLRDAIQHFAGERLRLVIQQFTSNRFLGMFWGAVFTVVLQSSTAMTVMLVGLTQSGIISLTQAMPILLGSDVGTTITVQLISFRLDRYSLFMVALGFALFFFGKKYRIKFAGQLLLGFGLIFYGIKVLIDSSLPLQNSEVFSIVLKYFGENEMLCLIFSTIITALIHSSAATLGVIISLAISGSMTIEVAIPFIYGANIGTCFTALLAGIGSDANGKRTAVAHVLFKIIGVVIFYPFTEYFAYLVSQTDTSVARQIANAHTIFNLSIAIILIPFSTLTANILKRFFRESEKEGMEFKPKYLDRSALSTPALALGYASREIMRMSSIVESMLRDTIKVFIEHDLDLLEDIQRRDNKVDILEREIKFYIISIDRTSVTKQQTRQEFDLISFISDLENIGDLINRTILEMARKMIKMGFHFSEEGKKELMEFHKDVMEGFRLSITAFDTNSEELARKAINYKEVLIEKEKEFKEAHIQRLHKGLKESINTSSIHLELLSHLRRANSIATRIAYAILERSKLE
ncbi:MAG: Na/Pi cotransporter family protein [Deltaproteobacteria bacterium]|nr:Na/Pi cotransporter family protein [Deltaproteobacteria bacterium]